MPTDGVHSPISNKQKHGAARVEDTERPKRLGYGAWGRRQGLAGLRDDAPSEARGADGERAGRDADAEQAARDADAEQAARDADAEQAARDADAEQAGRAGGPPPPGTNTQNTRIQRGRDPLHQTAQRTPAS